MDFNASLSRSALDSPYLDREGYLLGTSRAVDVEQHGEKVSENKKLGIVLGGLTANYCYPCTAQPDIRVPVSNDMGRLAPRNHATSRAGAIYAYCANDK